MNTDTYIPQTFHLNDVIHSIWQVGGHIQFTKEQIIPKGITEVIFNFSDGIPIAAQLNGKKYQLPNCFINGYNTSPIQLQLPEKLVFFGVRFQPLAVKKIFRTPACEFSDTVVDLALLDSTIFSIWHQLAEQDDFNARVSVFNNWLKRKIVDWHPREKMINDFLSSAHYFDQPVTELAGSLCYSSRQLSRKISEATGMNTEDILLYKKYLHAVHLIHHSSLSLTQIAHQSNFFDQSHFIRSFKAYTNMTPGEYQQTKSHVSGHIYE